MSQKVILKEGKHSAKICIWRGEMFTEQEDAERRRYLLLAGILAKALGGEPEKQETYRVDGTNHAPVYARTWSTAIEEYRFCVVYSDTVFRYLFLLVSISSVSSTLWPSVHC